MNLKLRLQNKTTTTAVLSNLFLIGYIIVTSIIDGDFTVENGYTIISLIVAILSILGIVVDPTTEGIGDSDCVKSQEMLLGKSDRKE